MNPCIDCHALMLKKASDIALAEKYEFIATGEVLGQRPFSQTREALGRVARLAGVEVLRPLSAKLLDATEIEKKGLAKREELLDVEGRQRERQMELARKYGIKEYPSPAGGCLLTDPAFSGRLKEMIEFRPDCIPADVELLKNGRVFWLKAGDGKRKILLIVGRNREENEKLRELSKNGDVVIELKSVMGPTSLVRISNFQFPIFNEFSISNFQLSIPISLDINKIDFKQGRSAREILELAGLLTGYYATKARGKNVEIIVERR